MVFNYLQYIKKLNIAFPSTTKGGRYFSRVRFLQSTLKNTWHNAHIYILIFKKLIDISLSGR